MESIRSFKPIAATNSKLPSTSPAYTISFEKKLSEWSVIKEYLGER